jgi:hypothetical protein
VHLLDSRKALVVDVKQVPDDSILLRVVAWGEVLPKGAKPGPEHVHKAKFFNTGNGTAPDKSVIRLTRNDKHKYKHYWDEDKDGPKPVKPKKKKTAEEAEIEAPPPPTASKKPKVAAAAEKKAKVVVATDQAAVMAEMAEMRKLIKQLTKK